MIKQVRQLQIQKRRLEQRRRARTLLSCGPAHYASRIPSVLIVLGSGGHTKEMLLMLEAGFHQFQPMHRHYVVSTGDHHSLLALQKFERDMAAMARVTGTYTSRLVRRARKVHQSWLTTPFSVAASMVEILPLLLRLKPDIILTNGPATGLLVSVAAHLIKFVGMMPPTKLHVLYVESWARVKSLSLTGKLIYYGSLADLFLVQHEPVAQAYGVVNAGWLVAPVRHGPLGANNIK